MLLLISRFIVGKKKSVYTLRYHKQVKRTQICLPNHQERENIC